MSEETWRSKELGGGVSVHEKKAPKHLRRKQDLVIRYASADGDMVVIPAGAVWRLFQFLQGRYWV